MSKVLLIFTLIFSVSAFGNGCRDDDTGEVVKSQKYVGDLIPLNDVNACYEKVAVKDGSLITYYYLVAAKFACFYQPLLETTGLPAPAHKFINCAFVKI